MKLKISLKKDRKIQFKALENLNTFKKFYSELPGVLQEKFPKAPNKLTSQTTKNYAKSSNSVFNDFELSNVTEEVTKKIFLSPDTSKATGRDHNSATFLSNNAKILALPLRNITNLSNKIINLPRGV